MAELRESALISAEECEYIAQAYSPYDPFDERKWCTRLMRVAIPKDTHVITKISTVLEEHKIPRISSVLRGVLCVGGVLSCIITILFLPTLVFHV